MAGPGAKGEPIDPIAEVVFDVDGERVSLSESEARVLAERLRVFAAGEFGGDAERLTAIGITSVWLAGARALADAIEEVLTETNLAPIQLDASGKVADAAYAALALSMPVSFDAKSGLHRLYNAIRDARNRQRQ